MRGLLARSTLLLNLTVHHNDRLLHERTKCFLVVVDGKNFCFGDDQRTAGADDLASGDQPLSVGRRNEIQFVLDGRDQSACNQRAAASAVSSGRVLNAMDAFGAALCTVLTTVSSNDRLFGGSRIPPPITTQS